MKIKTILMCSFAFLLLSISNVGAAEINMPIGIEEVENAIDIYDANTTVSEDSAWRNEQKVYSLTDGEGNKIAYLSSIGEQNEGTLNLILIRNEDSESELYKENYSTVIEFAMRLYNDTLDSSKAYDDFINAYTGKEEKDFEWRNTYNDTTISIKINLSAPVEVNITLYNSEKYNPFIKKADQIDYSAANPNIEISEISSEQFEELNSGENSEDDNFINNPNYRFYKIVVNDYNYHTNYKIDLSLFIKLNLLEDAENLEYEYILQNNSSGEYAFSDIVGYCQRKGNEIVALLGIPIVEIIKENETQYKEKFNYIISYAFSVEDLDNIEISAIKAGQ